MTTSGIYIIRNLRNEKAYIGQAVDMEKRWNNHRRAFRLGRHKNKHMQRVWNKYGEEIFLFEVLLECEPDRDELEEREREAVNSFIAEKGRRNLYNDYTTITASTLGYKHTKETRAKLSANMTPKRRAEISASLKGKKASPETRAKMSKALMGNTHTLGYKHSPEAKAKLSAAAKGNTHGKALKGIKRSPETRAKMSAAQKGKHPSPETKAKISASLKGRKLSPEHRVKLMGNTNAKGQKGYKHTPEARAKMSIAAKRRKGRG